MALNFTWNEKEELFWTFLYNKRKFLYFFFFLFYSFLILNRIHGSQLKQWKFVVFRVLKEFHLYRMYNTIDAKCHVELWIDWRVYSSASDQSTSSFYFLFIWSILQSLCRDIYYVCIYIYYNNLVYRELNTIQHMFD